MPSHVNHYILFAELTLISFFPSISQASSKTLTAKMPSVFELAKERAALSEKNTPLNRFPITTAPDGKWKTTLPSGWTSGFYPGLLWLLYEDSGNNFWLRKAVAKQAPLLSQQFNGKTHDIGFIIFNSFGNAYRLTGNAQYKKAALRAAKTLAARFNPRVGLIKSWDGKSNVHQTIIDNLMNLEILFWAANNGGDPRLKTIASIHAKNTLRDFLRKDGSTYHVVNYDSASGKIISKTTEQGYSADSTWSRGQAWAIYGFTIAYRETGDKEFLAAARKTADYFLKNLPADNIPYWDFSLTVKMNEPRDTSAAAIAASGLLELSKYENDASRKNRFFDSAERILLALSSDKYLTNEKSAEQNILRFGTYNRKAGEFSQGTVWGDYYFLEALSKYKKQILLRRLH